MTDILSTEVLLSTSLAGISALAMIASFILTRPQKDSGPKTDIDALVRDAPYHRLQEVGILVQQPTPSTSSK